MQNNDVAIILAGGQGSRFGGKKQFIKFQGKALWRHVYDKILTLLPKENIVVVGVDVQGGKSRSHSVINGLNYFKGKQIRKVLIAEAARPLVTIEQLKQILANNSESATFVMPLVNTPIKRDGTYVNRTDYYDLLPPQAFSFDLLVKAYESKPEWDLTDETRLMYEFYKIKPQFVEGAQNLFKVTYARDIPILKDIAKRQSKGEI